MTLRTPVAVALVVVCAALVGCGNPGTTTDLDGRTVISVQPGSPPPTPLRWAPEEGAVSKLAVSIGVDGDEEPFADIDRRVTASDASGFTVETTVVATPSDAIPGCAPWLEAAENIEDGLSIINVNPGDDVADVDSCLGLGLSGGVITEEYSARGQVLSRSTEGGTTGYGQDLVGLAKTIALLMPPLPEESLGDSPAWLVRIPSPFEVSPGVDAAVSVERTSERLVSEPLRPVELRLSVSGPLGDPMISYDFEAIDGDEEFDPVDQPETLTIVDDITGTGTVTLDLARATGTGEITFEFAASDLNDLPVGRRPSSFLDPSPIRVAVRRR